ncbi:MAG: V-type ATP synthase subunit D [Candidatus Aceula meridiana]|nr:V-type ATP synthase subunit D [Candidatus Aceula meridiana]
MLKIKLTKSELKKQRDSLKQFMHYLPTLQLKKQQLQIRIFEIRKIYAKKQAQLKSLEQNLKTWIGLLGDPGVDIRPWIFPEEILTDTQNIAGADIPVFKRVIFKDVEYDLYGTPFWIDEGIIKLRSYASLMTETAVVQKQLAVLEKELMTTTQRVNLFEKVKIPQCLENIRKIRIYLGDQQANAVGVSKVAKKKIEMAVLAEMAI